MLFETRLNMLRIPQICARKSVFSLDYFFFVNYDIVTSKYNVIKIHKWKVVR